jgi:exodeoxyribonuclease VII small subunit
MQHTPAFRVAKRSGVAVSLRECRCTQSGTFIGVFMTKASEKKSIKPIEELSYEDALTELEGIVELLEGEQNALEESMKLFERGQALVTHCSTLLESAQLKVQKLAGDSIISFEEESE